MAATAAATVGGTDAEEEVKPPSLHGPVGMIRCFFARSSAACNGQEQCARTMCKGNVRYQVAICSLHWARAMRKSNVREHLVMCSLQWSGKVGKSIA